MFLRISNKGSLNRMFLELTGFGSKRERNKDTSVIGFKGSGTKLAAVAAIRLGLDLAISSSDERGRYILTFESENVEADGHKSKRIVLVYKTIPKGSAVYSTPPKVERVQWFMTEDAFMDWDKPIGNDDGNSFKVLREFICNAYDEDRSMKLSLGDKIGFAPQGTTVVFIRHTDEVKKVVGEHPGRYFKFLVPDVQHYAVAGHGTIYVKSDMELTRLFHLGVLVGCEGSFSCETIYDYSLDDKDLIAEERTIKNWYRFQSSLGAMLASITDVSMAKQIFDHIVVHRTARLEASCLERVEAIGEFSARAWREVINDHFGSDKVCLPSDIMQLDGDAEQIYGYKVARALPSGFVAFMKKLGYPNARDVTPSLPETLRVRFDDLDEESRLEFRAAFHLCAKYFPQRAMLPIVFFYVQDERKRSTVLGYAAGKNGMKEIWIACSSPTSLSGDGTSLLKTLIHEGRHIETQAGDYDRKFMFMAENDIATLIFRAEGIRSFSDGNPVPEPGNPARIAPHFLPVSAVGDGAASGDDPARMPPATDDIDAMVDELFKGLEDDPKPSR